MSLQSVIVKDVDGQRLFWGETGLGLDWMESQDDAWVYDTRGQAKSMYRAVERLRRERAKILPYDDLEKEVS